MNIASTSTAPSAPIPKTSNPNCTNRELEIQGLLKGTENLKKFYVKYDPASSSECFCGRMVKMNGNTSNARRHIVKNHDDMVVFFLKSGKSIQDYSHETSESVNAGANKTHATRGDEMEPSPAKIPRITHYFEPLDAPVKTPMVQGKQLTLEETIKTARKVSYDGRLEVLREALLRFLCKTGTPLCCVSDGAVEKFIKTVYPGSKLLQSIAATDMLKDLMSSVAKAKRDEFYNALGDNPFSLDLQIVKVFEDKSLLGLFIYFLDKDNLSIRSSCYHSSIIKDSVTEVAVYDQIKEVLEAEEIQLENVIAVFEPQSELASSALQLLVDFKKILKISCFYDVIGDLKEMVVSSPICQLTLKLAVEVRNFINNDSEIFEEFQRHGNITNTNISRWLSPCSGDFENLDLFYSYSKLIAHSLSCVTDQIDVPEVSNVTFKKAKELISLLQIIKDVESSEKQSPPLYSQYLPHLQILNNNLKSMPLKDAILKNLKEQLTGHLDKKIEAKKLSKNFTACHILDPRYRKCLLDDNALVMLRVNQDAKAKLKEYVEKHNNQSLRNPSANPNFSSLDARASDASNSSEEDDPEDMPEDRTKTFSNKRAMVNMEISKFLSTKGGRRQPNLSCIEVAESNFDSYLKMTIVPENTNVFEFWNSRLAAQPVLAKMALDKLSVPGVRNHNLKTGVARSKAVLECGEELNDFVFLANLGDNYW